MFTASMEAARVMWRLEREIGRTALDFEEFRSPAKQQSKLGPIFPSQPAIRAHL